MEPYQERVLVERTELFIKLEKLEAFLDGPPAYYITAGERVRLMRQAFVMRWYLELLDERINVWC